MTDQGYGKDWKLAKNIDPSIPLKYSSAPTWTAANQIVPFLPQSNIYYVGNAGSASFNGKNDNVCFNSYASAISAVTGQSPTNRFAIVFIGGFRAIGNFVHPSYTTTYALDGGEIVGALAMDGADSMALIDKYTGPSSGNYGIYRGVSATGNAFVEIHGEANIGDFRGISNGSDGNFYVTINRLVASPAAQVWYAVIENLGTGSNLFVKINHLDASGGTANVVRPGAGNTYCEFGKVKSTTGSGAFIYTQGGDTGKAYIKVKDVDASAGVLTNLATATPEVHLEGQKASGAITGVTTNLVVRIGEGPVAGKRVTYSDGNLNASDNIAAGGNVSAGGNFSTSTGNISTTFGTVTARTGLIRNTSATATMDVYGAGSALAWSETHLYSDSGMFRAAGVRISQAGGAGQWWAGVGYSANGEYFIRYNASTNPEQTGTTLIRCERNGNFYLSSTGTIASTTGYQALYGRATDGLIKRFTSSEQYKTKITDMGDTSWLYQLRPVTFESTIKGDDLTLQYGLISEEVALVNDKIGRDDTVHYEQLISVLINEVKKLNDRIIALEAA